VWSIAPRVNKKGARFGALYRYRIVSGSGDEDLGREFLQPIGESDKWKYEGKIVVLIDERCQSHCEHTGLLLEAVSDAIFIGSATVGTNGDTTSLTVPGGLSVQFTGLEVRHVDGRQLQQVGLQPHLKVSPTVARFRAGQDEVLDRALRYLKDKEL